MSHIKLIITGLFLFCLTSTLIFTQSAKGPKFEFEVKNNHIQLDTMYLSDLDDEVNLEVKFTNTGNKPLIVTEVSGCCGTHIKGWTQQPIFPDKQGVIKVFFRVSPKVHHISRTVTARSNDPDGAKTLKIEGVVAEKKEDGLLQPK